MMIMVCQQKMKLLSQQKMKLLSLQKMKLLSKRKMKQLSQQKWNCGVNIKETAESAKIIAAESAKIKPWYYNKKEVYDAGKNETVE